jgi:predicted MFS family arabinose efflux permease
VLCAMSDDIIHLILARVVQGSGAVSSVAIASLGDVTRNEVRARAFTIVGLTIGGAFLIAIIAGPLLAAKIGFDTLFYVLAALGVIAILATLIFFPKIKKDEIKKETFIEDESKVLSMLRVPEMRKLIVSALIISFTVNMFVFIYPLSWTSLGVYEGDLWLMYLIALIPTALFVYPSIRRAEKGGTLRLVTHAAWACTALSFLIYPAYSQYTWVLYLSGMAYFAGHTVLQSLFPAFLTQRVGQKKRGATTGLYNLAGFFGAAIGGMLAGYLYQINPNLPVIAALSVIILWGVFGLPEPPGAITTDE